MKTNNKSGITLIALIITVIIMLILAGVSISALMGESGLFSQARLAVNKYEEAVQNEEDILQEVMNEMSSHFSSTPSEPLVTPPVVDTISPTVATIGKSNVAQTTFTLEATGADETSISKYEFYINGVLEETVDTTDTTATINVTGKTAGNEYTCKVIVYDGANNFLESSEITVNTLIVMGSVVTSNMTINGLTTGTYSNPIIPKGFAPINENGATWGSADGYQKGLVIQDAIGNQFVWVPVDGTTVTFARYDFGKLAGGYDNYTETVPTVISDSVRYNKGFYIGRYEAGYEGEVAVSAVSKGGVNVNVYNNINWSDSKSKAEAMYTSGNINYGVTSTLIYGTQWDTALKFIGAYNVGEAGYSTYATNSTGMGNYSGTSGGDTTTAQPATCGLLDAFRQKNIYDMAGNVYEWTMEAYSSYRVDRGGCYLGSGSDGPAAYRNYDGSVGAYSDVGFRVGLYIK